MLGIVKASKTLTMLGLLALTFSACGSDDPTASGQRNVSDLRGTLTGRGASSQNSAVDAWKVGFSQKHSQARVQYSPDGSGAGKTALLSGAADFAGSDSYLNEAETEQSKQVCGTGGAINLPVYISPIVVAYNLPGSPQIQLSATTIAKIFNGTITNWNSTEISAENSGINLPDLAITAVHRSDESGTTQNFTDYLHKNVPDVWTEVAAQAFPKNFGGEAAKGTSGVIQTVQSAAGAIGYADQSGVGSALQIAEVKVGFEFVAPSAKTAAKAVEISPLLNRFENDLAVALTRDTEEPGVYPIVLVSYHIVCSQYDTQEKVDLVKAWESYVVSEEGQENSQESAGSTPIPQNFREKINSSLASIRVVS